jgi:putative Holliday junction resolvase
VNDAAVGFRPGARLGIDVGDVRVGIATSDPDGVLATPVETLRRGAGDIARIVELGRTYDVVEIVVGLPVTLAGAVGPAAEKARAFALRIEAEAGAREWPVSVRLSDERLTTVSAERVLREQGRRGPARRAVVDQAAAVVILQHALDAERLTGKPPGTALPGPEERPAP